MYLGMLTHWTSVTKLKNWTEPAYCCN